MSERVLPRLEPNEDFAQLPSDPRELLTVEQRDDLAERLSQLARLRRDVEATSAALKLA